MTDHDPYSPESIVISRHGTASIDVSPRAFTLDADAFGVPEEDRHGQFRLDVGTGWVAEPLGPLCWRISAREIDVDRPVRAVLRRLLPVGGQREWTWSIPVTLDLHSTLDPITHTFPEPNRAAVLGDVNPEREIFAQTYDLPLAWLSDRLFAGLYSDIVFLRREGPTRGGLCSGMARWSIARAQGVEPEPPSREDAIRRITTFHGRQLNDRAFLMGAPWFLRASPGAAYRAVRRDLLNTGTSDRALDVNVPKPWRRDVVQALIRQGHTIVPYRVLQLDPSSARVEVYDPNRPPATLENPEAIEFDLKNDRYRYRHMVSMEQSNVGMIAVRQRAYSRRGTAILAGLASAALWFASGRGVPRTA